MSMQVTTDSERDDGLFGALLAEVPDGVLEPARRVRMRERLMARVADAASDAAVRPLDMVIIGANQGRWLPLLPKVKLKPLRVDLVGRTQTSLWRLEPGAVVPAHDHTAEEECLVLAGELLWDGVKYGRGDFLLAPAGLHHTPFSAPQGALLMIRSELTPHLERLFAS